MARALGWLALGGLLLLAIVLMLAPGRVAGPAFVVAGVMVVPGIVMLAIAGAARRRRGGRVSTADASSFDHDGG